MLRFAFVVPAVVIRAGRDLGLEEVIVTGRAAKEPHRRPAFSCAGVVLTGTPGGSCLMAKARRALVARVGRQIVTRRVRAGRGEQ